MHFPFSYWTFLEILKGTVGLNSTPYGSTVSRDRLQLVDVDGECGFAFDGRFAHILCLDGEGSVGDVPICKGGSCIVFDECDVRTMSGRMKIIVSYCG